jgi:N-acetylglucosamine kinase-like BadF-type ATPase
LEKLKEKLELKNNEDIIEWTYKDLSWNRIASLSILAQECHEMGDEVSTKILKKAAEGLINYAECVVKKMEWNEKEFTFVLAGSVVSNKGLIQEIIFSELKEKFPKCSITLPIITPEMGSAYLLFN